MLSRRTLIGSTAVLAAGCGFLESQAKVTGPLQETSLNLAFSDAIASLTGTHGVRPLENSSRQWQNLQRMLMIPMGSNKAVIALPCGESDVPALG